MAAIDEPAFVVDFDDPADLVLKHGRAVVMLAGKRRQLQEIRDLERQVEIWEARVRFLASQIPEPAEPGHVAATNGNGRKRNAQGSVLDLVVEVVNREPRPIKAKTVYTILAEEGHDLTTSAVSGALNYASREGGPGRIRTAVGRGMYAPLDYPEPPPAAESFVVVAPTVSRPLGGPLRER